MSHIRWQVRIVYADRDERGVVAVLRADPVEWESGHPLRGGRVLAEIIEEAGGYRWESQDLAMCSSAPFGSLEDCKLSLIHHEDRLGRLELGSLDPIHEYEEETHDLGLP